MAGNPPPEDAPPPDEQGGATDSNDTFEDSPTGIELCGFPISLPTFSFPSFSLPAIDFGFPPSFSFAIGLACDLKDPIDAEPGGGRVGDEGLDDDPEFKDDAATNSGPSGTGDASNADFSGDDDDAGFATPG